MTEQGTNTLRPLRRRRNAPKTAELTQEQANEIGFAFWRWDMWAFHDQGSYEDIHRRVIKGELVPGVCPTPGCDCQWSKKEET